MNTLIRALNTKLSALGYNELVIKSIISKLDISLIEKKINETEDYSEYIDVYFYDEPCVDIIRAFLNINNNLYFKFFIYLILQELILQRYRLIVQIMR